MKQSKKPNAITLSIRALVLLSAALCATLALGQNTGAGTITGVVTDPSGSVVPDAVVVVRNTDTRTDRTMASSAAGVYVAPFLQPGNYEITASKAGFSKILRKDLNLQVGQTMTINLQIPLQSTTDTVTVSGEAPVVDTEKTEMSQVVSATQQENLPLAGRRWESFAQLTPNVTTDGPSGLVSYRGLSGLYNQSAVDGTNNSQAFFSETKGRTTIPYIYSMDSIQEFQVTSSNYSAELGQAAGGVVNAVTRSGSNVVHGDLFYYLRYPTWNALDSLQKSKGIYTQPIHQQQQFGGSVGGPAIKDKLFYFFTYDGSRKINPISYTSTATFPIACSFKQISVAQCASANNYLASLLGTSPRFQNLDVGFGKLDYQVSSANRVSASFNLDNFKSPNSYNTSTTANNLSNTANGTAVTKERIFVASWDSTISPTMINNFRFQWSRDEEVIGANDTGPSVSIQNVMTYGLPNALPRPAFPDEHRMQFADVLSKTVDKHTFKFGADVNVIHEVLINLFQGGGVYAYNGSTSAAFSNWAADMFGVNVGDGLTGKHYSTFVQVTDPVTGVGKDDFYNNDVALFAEDSWKVRPNLTLNLGIRYDLFLIPAPPKPNTSTPLTTLYTSTINIDKKQFAPRLGMAWALRPGTVLRVGYGMFYAKTSNSTYYATRVENGEFQQTYNCTPVSCPSLLAPNLLFTPPGGAPVAPFAGALTPVVTPITLGGNTATTRGQSPNWTNPLVHEGEVTLEHQLPGNMSISASYVMSRGLHLPVFVDSNLGPTTTTKSFDYVNAAGVTQSTLTLPFYTAANRLNATGPILTGFSVLNSLYNSAVFTFHKRMSRGVEFVANYTLSKAEDDGQVPGTFGTFNGTDSPVDPLNLRKEWSLSDLNQKNRFSGNLIYKPTFTKNIHNKGARLVADGWAFSTIVTAATGQPVTGTISGTPAGAIDGGLTGGTVNNSGTPPSTYRDPNAVRNAFTGPGFWDVDARIGRDFAIRERLKFSIVGEAFNIFNHTNVFAVNTQQFSYTAPSATSTTCPSASHTNGCVVPVSTFLTPTATNTVGGYGARQLQVSARIVF